jgi:hypothetical protein
VHCLTSRYVRAGNAGQVVGGEKETVLRAERGMRSVDDTQAVVRCEGRGGGRG